MKLKKNEIHMLLFLIAAVLLAAGCSGTRPALDAGGNTPPVVPAGVDSSVALRADSLARQIFVPWPVQQRALAKADSAIAQAERANALWQAFAAAQRGGEAAPADTLLAVQKFNEGAQNIRAYTKLKKSGAAARARMQQLLERARSGLEQAVQLDPFDRQSRFWLARVYQWLAERFLADRNWAKSAETLENLVHMDKSQHAFYGLLGQAYLSLKKWPYALRSFQNAEAVLRQTALFQVPEGKSLERQNIAAALDSAALFQYTFYQGEANIRMYRADSALDALHRARVFVRTAQDREAVESTLDWIDWDGGNIRAAEVRDSILTLVDRGRFKRAAVDFEKLLPRLQTRRARREINWQIALLEFSHLGQEDHALQRMQHIVKELQAGAAASGPDTLREAYFNAYGTMCYNQGLKTLRAKKLRAALAYFEQSTAVPWPQRAKSHLEIAKLSVNNPARAVEAAAQAWQAKRSLNPEERQLALNILVESFKRLGKYEQATKYFRLSRQLQLQAQKNDAPKN